MPKLLQINITANWGSHGKIAEGIGNLAMSQGWESYIAYGRWFNKSRSVLYHIGSQFDEYVHGFASRIFDNQGLMSRGATYKLIRFINDINPDIIHLHNIHGYYLNYPLLFDYLSKSGIPVVWTFHDCWPYTGHCAHYMFAGCDKWKALCQNCEYISNYPKSILFDKSERNYNLKKQTFLSVDNLTIVPVSHWLEGDVRQSFFKDKEIHQIYNGIDTTLFSIRHNEKNVKDEYHIPLDNKIIMGIASNWYHKGLDDFIKLRSILASDYTIIIIGLNNKELRSLPKGIIGVARTQNADKLIDMYSAADVLFNPTWEDNIPTVNLEAISCGTPVITYDTGGCSEIITPNTGYVIKKGNIIETKLHIEEICSKGKDYYPIPCRKSAVQHFNQDERFQEYINLYNNILNK